MTNFKISVVSDTVCPWCYVGKKKLERGIAIYKAAHPSAEDTFSTTWLPYYLNPDAPKTGIDKQEYFKKRFGEQRTSIIFERLSAVGRDVGINFKYGGKTGNSRDSHRLVQLGKTKGPEVETKVVEALFQSYFENEQDITSHDVLEAVGVKGGLEREEVRSWLQSDKGGKEVDREVREAQIKNISGVPNFTLQGMYEIGGAQDPENFARMFEKIKEVETA